MMGFGNLFRRKEEKRAEPEIEQFQELQAEAEDGRQTKVMVEKLDGFVDTDRIIRKARAGNIVIVGIKEIKERNMDELKHSISKMKTSVAVFNGDIAGVGDEWLILTPPTARIHREK